MTLDLKRLRCFHAVAEELHFGRAAARLHMAQPPLSRQIRALEREVGVQLFERTTRHVALTEAARVLLPHVTAFLTHADALERRIDDHRSGDAGVLRFGFVDSSSYDVMPALLREFRRRWPKVEYELTTMSSDEQIEALGAGRIDLGLGRTSGARADLASTPVRTEPLVLAVDGDHRRAGNTSTSLARLRDESFIGFDRRVSPSLHTELTQLLSAHDVAYDPVIEATEYTTVLGLVAAGQGVAIVPAGVRSFRPEGLRFVALDDAEATSTLMLLWRADHQSTLIHRITSVAEETFGD